MSNMLRTIESAGLPVVENFSLAPLTTYRVGGAARGFVDIEGPQQLALLGECRPGAEMEVLVLGNGSNLLVSDAGFEGLAIRLGAGFSTVSVIDTTVTAGSSALLPVVARMTVAGSLAGFEWAVGVPGTVGGAVRMNAGGHGSDISATLSAIRAVDLRTGENLAMASNELDLGYRHSNIASTTVVSEAEFHLRRGNRQAGEAELSEIVRWRRENQPGGANAGSVFANPAGESAGQLIDAAGCKGLRVGTAAVSDKHANFIQADSNGSADDVHELMVRVIDIVQEQFGVQLRPETRLVGFPNPVGGL